MYIVEYKKIDIITCVNFRENMSRSSQEHKDNMYVR